MSRSNSSTPVTLGWSWALEGSPRWRPRRRLTTVWMTPAFAAWSRLSSVCVYVKGTRVGVRRRGTRRGEGQEREKTSYSLPGGGYALDYVRT